MSRGIVRSSQRSNSVRELGTNDAVADGGRSAGYLPRMGNRPWLFDDVRREIPAEHGTSVAMRRLASKADPADHPRPPRRFRDFVWHPQARIDCLTGPIREVSLDHE